jgi:hypothetical protein
MVHQTAYIAAAPGAARDDDAATIAGPGRPMMLPLKSLWLLAACFALIAPLLTGCGEADDAFDSDSKAARAAEESTGAASLRGKDEHATYSSNSYLIGAFPNLNMISYARLPDATWRPLIAEGFNAPSVITVDQGNARLFVADTTTSSIYFFQLTFTPEGEIKVGGMKVAATSVNARGLATDGVGNLFIAGRRLAPPPETTQEAILKLDAVAIATANAVPATTTMAPAVDAEIPYIPGTKLAEIWTKANSAPIGGTAKLYSAAAIAVDPMHIFWGNNMKGTESGSVVQGSMEAGTESSKGVEALARNAESVTCMALTSNAVFYGAHGWLYGFTKSQGLSCAANDEKCGVVASMPKPTSLAWDGDSTLYISEASEGAVYSVPSASTKEHTPQLVISAPGLQALAVVRNIPQQNLKATSAWQWW